MNKEDKNLEGQVFSDDSEREMIDVNAEEVVKSDQNTNTEDKKTIQEWEKEESKDKKIQNLISAVIILAGLLLGSVFVDISQFITKSGYSERALKDAELFQLGEKTWVAYEEAPIEMTVLVPGDEEMKDCPECDPTDVIKWLRQNFPTLVAKKVETTSKEGNSMIEKYGLKTVPSFVFDEGVLETNFYQDPQVQAIFNEQDGKFVLNSTALGIPIGKYLEIPEMEEGDAVFGNPEAETKMIVFSDFQCPYSKMFFETAMSVMEDYENEISFVHKDLPLSFHPQAQNAAMAARCAQGQDKFWEMAEALFADQGNKEKTSAWDNQTGTEVFSTYANQIGLNTSEFNTCMENGEFADKIKKDEALAVNFGISGTPSGFVGDEFLGGGIQEDQLRSMFDEKISENK
ncbi:MAG: DsbA family protein [Patescibacteria group bacterium]|jgi:protein-disulfide isomerase|nr:DsbA family protein [Patescibacteria group bacterium]